MLLKNNIFIWLVCIFMLTSFSERKPKILIIGDSISIGYTPFVKNHFSDSAIVKHNPGNAQHTATGLKKIQEWIGDEDWDIIQFNWGLWDLCYRDPNSKVQGSRDKINGKITFSLEDYERNIERIVKSIQEVSNAQLIFVTTSYVPEHEAGRFLKDAQKYNKVAKRIMKKYNVTVNDIYKKSKAIHKEFGKGTDDVHYIEKGYEKLGVEISIFLNTEVNQLKQ
tara:strand:- start:2094 stop:2762 length:669 start_codon:yes stop_codon:yes gene_type:complete